MKLYCLLMISSFLFSVSLAIYLRMHCHSSYGTVIILNGPSAAGKSSIQREFQFLMMPDLWLKLGIDTLFDKPMPDITLENIQFWTQKNPIRWVETTQDQEGNPVITLFTGPEGEKVA